MSLIQYLSARISPLCSSGGENEQLIMARCWIRSEFAVWISNKTEDTKIHTITTFFLSNIQSIFFSNRIHDIHVKFIYLKIYAFFSLSIISKQLFFFLSIQNFECIFWFINKLFTIKIAIYMQRYRWYMP